jgi:dTDP-4-dehydrorhamnose 3,5-epimerase
MIDGVVSKQLTSFGDERGVFRELIRVTDDFFREGFGQLSHAVVYPGVAKAWHIHERQVDWWYVATGIVKVALHDARPGSPTYRRTMELLMGDDQPARVIRVPPGVAHGYRCIQGPAHVLYVTSIVYDATDEGRIPHDDPTIGYDWLRPSPIK